MFEITVRGRTMQFETAQEMEEWRQRMLSPRRTQRNQPRKRKPRKPASYGLAELVKRKRDGDNSEI